MAKSEVPNWLRLSLRAADLEKIEAAVREVEIKTSAEIVPMVVRGSVSLETVQRLLFLALALVLVIVSMLAVELAAATIDAFAHGLADRFGLWLNEAAIQELHFVVRMSAVLLAVVWAWISARMFRSQGRWARWLVPQAALARECEHRAELELFASGARSTAGRTGVLIFVSMAEHRAVVLADEAIAKRLPESTWETLLKELLTDIRADKMGDGFVKAIGAMGEKLAPLFPPAEVNHDEISNRLRILD